MSDLLVGEKLKTLRDRVSSSLSSEIRRQELWNTRRGESRRDDARRSTSGDTASLVIGDENSESSMMSEGSSEDMVIYDYE